MRCDNDSSMGHTIIAPACYQKIATKKVVIKYNDVERDTLSLCDRCADAIKADAQRHGYKVAFSALK